MAGFNHPDFAKTRDNRIHANAGETEKRSYERLRETGVPADTAKKIASDAARQTHTKLDKG